MGKSWLANSSFMGNFQNLTFDNISRAIKMMRIDWVGVATFFAGGIVIGYLFRRYFKDLITWLLILTVMVIVLDYMGLVAIRWDTIQAVVGTSPAKTVDTALHVSGVWIKNNVPVVISFGVGFMVGLKAG